MNELFPSPEWDSSQQKEEEMNDVCVSRAFCLALVSQWKEECGKQEERQRNIQQVVLCLFKILSERKRILFASAFSLLQAAAGVFSIQFYLEHVTTGAGSSSTRLRCSNVPAVSSGGWPLSHSFGISRHSCGRREMAAR
jgi:hypothetical protein